MAKFGKKDVEVRASEPPQDSANAFRLKGSYALPGGFVETGQTVEEACRREIKEETGFELHDLRLMGVYSNPERDPRGHVVFGGVFLGRRRKRSVCLLAFSPSRSATLCLIA